MGPTVSAMFLILEVLLLSGKQWFVGKDSYLAIALSFLFWLCGQVRFKQISSWMHYFITCKLNIYNYKWPTQVLQSQHGFLMEINRHLETKLVNLYFIYLLKYWKKKKKRGYVFVTLCDSLYPMCWGKQIINKTKVHFWPFKWVVLILALYISKFWFWPSMFDSIFILPLLSIFISNLTIHNMIFLPITMKFLDSIHFKANISWNSWTWSELNG